MLLGLLAAEITACTGRDPSEIYGDLTSELGTPIYQRTDVAATSRQRATLKSLQPNAVSLTQLAGEPIIAVENQAPGSGEPLGGLRVRAQNGWFAARPSGTEDIYKIYAESFLGPEHLERIQSEAEDLISELFNKAALAEGQD